MWCNLKFKIMDLVKISMEELEGAILRILDSRASHPRLVFGIKGLAELLNISIPKAQNLKNSGILDEAMYQIGRKLAFDADKVLALQKVVPDERPCSSANLFSHQTT